jgi:hypothetical protein
MNLSIASAIGASAGQSHENAGSSIDESQSLNCVSKGISPFQGYWGVASDDGLRPSLTYFALSGLSDQSNSPEGAKYARIGRSPILAATRP